MPNSSNDGTAPAGEPAGGAAPQEMREHDLPEILAIEQASFATPWTRASFVHELRENPFAWNLVMRRDGRVAAYASLWIVDDELRINDIAVDPRVRRRRIGTRLLEWILREAARRGCRRAVLEVRPSNEAARRLYARFGFRQTGVRRGYYQDRHEDALVLEADLAAPGIAPA